MVIDVSDDSNMAPVNEPMRQTKLARESCLELLRNARYARVVTSIKCLPVALPVHIAIVEDGRLLLTSNNDAITSLASNGDVLAVQIDGLEQDGVTWSVTVSGIARPAQLEAVIPDALVYETARGAALLSLPLDFITGIRIE